MWGQCSGSWPPRGLQFLGLKLMMACGSHRTLTRWGEAWLLWASCDNQPAHSSYTVLRMLVTTMMMMVVMTTLSSAGLNPAQLAGHVLHGGAPTPSMRLLLGLLALHLPPPPPPTTSQADALTALCTRSPIPTSKTKARTVTSAAVGMESGGGKRKCIGPEGPF